VRNGGEDKKMKKEYKDGGTHVLEGK
jgi:hypothetical protein